MKTYLKYITILLGVLSFSAEAGLMLANYYVSALLLWVLVPVTAASFLEEKYGRKAIHR